MKELHTVRSQDHQKIDEYLTTRQGWVNDLRSKNFGGSWHAYGLETPITDEHFKNCHALCDFLIDHKDESKLVISVNWGWFYTNDLKLFEKLGQFSFIEVLNYTEATIVVPRGAIRVLSSPNRFRSYFRSKKLTQEQKANLQNFVENNPEIRCSPALEKWLNRETSPYWSTWCRDSYFIDYDSEYMLTMLGLVCHNVIRKTLNIVNDK